MLRIEQYQLEQWQSQRYLCVLRQGRDLYAVLFAVKKLNALMHIYDADAFALLNHIRVQCSLDGLHTFGLNAHTIIPYAYLPVSYTHLDVYKRQGEAHPVYF